MNATATATATRQRYSNNDDDGEKKEGRKEERVKKNVTLERMSYEIIIAFDSGGAAASRLLSKARIDVIRL